MKLSIKITALFISSMVFVACKDGEKTNHKFHKEHNTEMEQSPSTDAGNNFSEEWAEKAWEDYLQLQQALAANDAARAKTAAGSMAGNFEGDHAEAKELSDQIAKTGDIEKQRALFSALTEKMGPDLEAALESGTLYKKFCPMAFSNEGAFWYSDVEEIRNPYFGDRMLRCGSVKETIAKNGK